MFGFTQIKIEEQEEVWWDADTDDTNKGNDGCTTKARHQHPYYIISAINCIGSRDESSSFWDIGSDFDSNLL